MCALPWIVQGVNINSLSDPTLGIDSVDSLNSVPKISALEQFHCSFSITFFFSHGSPDPRAVIGPELPLSSVACRL